MFTNGQAYEIGAYIAKSIALAGIFIYGRFQPSGW
jgi:hypothetical protein